MTSTKQTPFPPKTPSPNLNLFIPTTTPPPAPPPIKSPPRKYLT